MTLKCSTAHSPVGHNSSHLLLLLHPAAIWRPELSTSIMHPYMHSAGSREGVDREQTVLGTPVMVLSADMGNLTGLASTHFCRPVWYGPK